MSKRYWANVFRFFKNMKKEKEVFFDVYQTIIDIDIDGAHRKINEAKAWECFAELLERYGVHTTAAEFIARYDEKKEEFYARKDRKIYHHNFCELTARILKEGFGADLPDADISSLAFAYHKIARGYARLYPGVAETLATLKKRYVISVASYTQGCYTQPELKELGIDQFFSYFVYTSDVGLRKSSPLFYQKCLQIAGKESSDCAMVGDHYHDDVFVPQSLGMKAVWIQNPLTQYKGIIAKQPEFGISLSEFTALPDVIDKLWR